MSEDVEIKSIDRGYGKTVKVKISTWKEIKYIDIREYYTSDSEEELPTKKGVRLPFDTLDELIEALNEAKERSEE